MFFPIFVSSFFYLILDSIPFFPPFFLFFSFFSFSFFSFFFSFLDTNYNPTSIPPEPVTLLFSLVDPYLWIFSSRHRQSLEVIPDVEGRATRSKGHRQDKRKEGVSMHRGQRVARP